MISIVCPFYNESGVIDHFLSGLYEVLNKSNRNFEVICIDDGSNDTTLEELLCAQKTYSSIRVVSLSRNFGKEAALSAGLQYSKGDACVPIDTDLQDPPELILDFIRFWQEGYDVVIAKRTDRSTDTLLKSFTASTFYKIHNAISSTPIPENVGDYRLMSRKVVNVINALPENRRFMKGLFSWVGFRTKTIEYARLKRVAGESKFNGWRLWNFAIEGITSFSTTPLRIWTYVGMFIALFAFIYGAYIFIKTIIFGVVTPGFTTIIVAILFSSGVQLIGIGVLGEYLGRVYDESKKRPIFVVDNVYEEENLND